MTRAALILAAALVLAGCGPSAVSPKEIAAKRDECHRYGLRAVTLINVWDGSIEDVRCET